MTEAKTTTTAATTTGAAVVEGCSMKTTVSAQPRNPTKLRSVCFSEEKNETFVFEEPPVEFIGEKWFTPDEFVVIKAKSRAQAKELRRQGYGILLKHSFEAPRPDSQDYLEAFCRLEGSRSLRGLERQLSRQHGEERSSLKDRARYVVLVHQQRLQQEGLKGEQVARQLADVYRQVCQPACVFARSLAKSDELVASKGEDSSAAERIVEAELQQQNKNYHYKMERRLSNCSVLSGNSVDSRRLMTQHRHYRHHHHPPHHPHHQPGSNPSPRRYKAKCPSSPASPMEEYYAAIA